MNKCKINKTNLLLWIFTCMISLLVFINSSVLFADGLATIDYNYINDHIGDKAIGLGGAFTAIADDPSGAYYNPAGLAFAFDNQISLSVNSYKEKNIKFEKAITDRPYTQDIASFYPSFFGIVQGLGSFKFAITIINMNNEILDQDDYFNGIRIPDAYGNYLPATFNINYNLTDNTLLGGLSLAHFLSDSISIGVTVYGLRRRIEQISNQLLTVDTAYSDGAPITLYQITNNYITEMIYGAISIFGIQIMPLDILSIGVSLGFGKIINHDYSQQFFQKQQLAEMDFNSPYIDFRFLYDREDINLSSDKMPVVTRIGVAFFPNSRLTLSADIIAHIGDKYYHNTVKDTYNGAIGMEYYVTKSFPVRLGFFTNFANTPKISSVLYSQEMHIDLYGGSMSLSWQTKSSSISLSGFYQTGKGKSQIISGSRVTQDAILWAYSVALTGSAKY